MFKKLKEKLLPKDEATTEEKADVKADAKADVAVKSERSQKAKRLLLSLLQRRIALWANSLRL